MTEPSRSGKNSLLLSGSAPAGLMSPHLAGLSWGPEGERKNGEAVHPVLHDPPVGRLNRALSMAGMKTAAEKAVGTKAGTGASTLCLPLPSPRQAVLSVLASFLGTIRASSRCDSDLYSSPHRWARDMRESVGLGLRSK